MFRKYVIVAFAMMLFLAQSSCTSKSTEENGSDVEVSSGDDALEEADASATNDDLNMDSSSGGGSEVAASDDGGGGELDDLGDGGDMAADSGSAVADNGAAGEVTPNDLSDAPPADAAPTDDLAASEPAPMDAAPPADEMSSPTPDPEMAPPPAEVASEPPLPEPETAAPSSDAGFEEAKPAVGSLKKINSQPYKVGKTLVNAVYLAREGDTVESIAQKVGVSQKDICKVNEYNCSRPTKVGDKYYYNSPQRPTDDTIVKTFYEDAGVAPEVYTAKAGDNIRKVGKDLLGSDRSWMELWATNDVESKGDLDEGTQLKYWPKTDMAAPTQAIAQTEPEAAPPTEAAPPPPTEAPPMDEAAAPPPPPPQEQQTAQNELPPSPDPNAAAAGTVEPPPPPPPPPPPVDNAQPTGDMAAGDMQDQDQTMMLGVGAVLLLAAAALFISIRKKRQRRQIDFNTTTQTQIE